jgi:glycosyltransferase involved in cell wall biosynthesis
MKILHVVTLVSLDGAYGGPLSVALNQTRELIARGHSVEILAGWQGDMAEAPREIGTVPLKLVKVHMLLPGGGFSGLGSLALLIWLRRNIGSYDLVHVHAGRELVTAAAMTAAVTQGVPFVTQSHGMVDVDGRLKSRFFDLWIVRPLFRRAAQRLVLTASEDRALCQVLGEQSERVQLMNGVPLQEVVEAEPSSGPLRILYCARIQERKRPESFVLMAQILRQRGIDARYSIVGPDEGMLASLLELIASLGIGDIVTYEGPLSYEKVLERMRRADIYVLPSVDEPFPMSLLEAMSVGLASICTVSCGIAPIVDSDGSALVSQEDPAALADAVEILNNSLVRNAVSSAALNRVRNTFGIEHVVDQLEGIYRKATLVS